MVKNIFKRRNRSIKESDVIEPLLIHNVANDEKFAISKLIKEGNELRVIEVCCKKGNFYRIRSSPSLSQKIQDVKHEYGVGIQQLAITKKMRNLPEHFQLPYWDVVLKEVDGENMVI